MDALATHEYSYDVAFSFLAADEQLATALNDLLQDRLKTFLYSKRQAEIAGTDGEEKFNDVFGKQARLVVVLYRNGWGESSWTRIEETAIRNRAFEDGYEFVKFIPLEDPPTVPKWLPRTQIWIGLKRWGLPGAAAAIEARVQEMGGEPREETAEDRAARLDRSNRFFQARHEFLHSKEGVKAANEEFETLRREIERLIASINDTGGTVNLKLKAAAEQIVVFGLGPGLSICWSYRHHNILEDYRLTIELWDRHPPYPGIQFFEEPRRLSTEALRFDMLPLGALCWITDGQPSRAYTTKDLASQSLKIYMDLADSRAPH